MNTGRTRRTIWTLLAVPAAVATLLLTGAPAAQAMPPSSGSWDVPPNDFVDPDVCAYLGIVVTGTEWESASWQINWNKDGTFKEGFVHHKLHVIVHANGKTMYEDDTWTELFRNGTLTQVGNLTHEQMDGANIVQDAGMVVLDADGNIVRVTGRHPTLNGLGMCPFFLPTT